jgi:CheY-like chemotaxis protein
MRNSKPILLVKRAIKDLKVPNPLIHRTNGDEALQYLRQQGNDVPCVILLDLNMPKMDGIEFLKIVKADDALKKIPVIVLTSSKEESDKISSFALSVAGYMTKLSDYKKFLETVKMINSYWTLSELPNGD